MRKHRIITALLLLVVLSLSPVCAYADGTVLTTTVPEEHTVHLQIVGSGTVTVNGESYSSDADLAIERFSQAEYAFSVSGGSVLSQVVYGGSTVTSKVSGGRYTAPELKGDTTMKVVFTQLTGAYAEVYGCSLSLQGNIGLNYYVIPSAELLADPGAYVTIGGTQYPFSSASTRQIAGETLYQFSISLHAKQMTDSIVLRAYNGSGTKVDLICRSTGENCKKNGYPYSVQAYVAVAREKSTDAKLIALVNAMSDYGSLAQVQFNYRTSARVPVLADLSSVTAADLARYQLVKSEGKATGVSFSGNSLLLQSETAMRFYFTLDEGEIGDYTFKLGSKKVTPVQNGNLWYVEVANIHAKDLDTAYTVTVSSAAGKIVSVKASALTYAHSVLSSTSSTNALKDLVKGLYLYNRAANAYFG